MKTQYWWRAIGVVSLIVGLMAWPGAAMAADADLDGIDDSVESGAGIMFNGTNYPPCVPGLARNTCLSPTSQDIFIYLVRSTSGFLATNVPALDNAAFLFQFITEPRQTTGTGKINGLEVGVHVAFVTAVPADRVVAGTPQSAVLMIADDTANSSIFGKADVGTPSATGNATVYPLTIKNYVNNLKGGDNPTVWMPYIQNVFSHELSHVVALFATYNSRYGGYHTKTGTGVVMDEQIVYNSNKKTFAIPTDYASPDNPCLLRVDTSNPLRCVAF